MSGPGRKLRKRVDYVRQFVSTECEMLYDLGPKIAKSTLLQMCEYAVNWDASLNPWNPASQESDRPIIDQIERNFFEQYCKSVKIALRTKNGKKARWNEFTAIVEKNAFHFGILARGFRMRTQLRIWIKQILFMTLTTIVVFQSEVLSLYTFWIWYQEVK